MIARIMNGTSRSDSPKSPFTQWLAEMGVAAKGLLMSSRHPTALGARSHDRAARKRNRGDAVALRRATAGNRAAQQACLDLRRRLAGREDATAMGLRCIGELIQRALERRQHVDGAIIDRLQDAVERIDLRDEAARFDIKPDLLAEVRMLARDLAAQLLPAI